MLCDHKRYMSKASESELSEAGVCFLLSFLGFNSSLYNMSFSFGHIASVQGNLHLELPKIFQWSLIYRGDDTS